MKGRKMYNTCDLQGFARREKIFMWLVCSYPVVDFCHGSEFENPTKEIGFKGFML